MAQRRDELPYEIDGCVFNSAPGSLVVGSAPGATKLRDAEKHGTRRLGEAEFRKLVGA